MGIREILPLLSITANFGIGLYVYYRDPNSKVNRLFLASIITLIFWAAGEFLMKVAVSLPLANFGAKLGSLGWCTSGAVYIHFCLALTGNETALKKRSTYFALYLPAIFWVCITIFTNLVFKTFRPCPYGGYWEVRGPIRLYSMIYLALAFFFGLILLANKYLKSVEVYQKRRIGSVFIASAVPIAVGIMSDFLLPYFNIYLPVNAVAIFPFLGIVIAYAVTKYDLMTAITSHFGHEIVSSIQDALFITDGAGYIEFANQAAHKMLEYPPGKLEGINVSTLFTEPLFSESDKPFENAYPGSVKSEGLNTLLTSKGSQLLVTLSTGAIRTRKGKPIGMVIVARDLTTTAKLIEAKRKAMEVMEELEFLRRKSESISKRKDKLTKEVWFLQRLIDNLPEGIIIKDMEGNTIFANRAARILFGITAGETASFQFESFLPEENHDEVKSAEADAYLKRNTYILDNLPVIDSNGNKRVIKLIIAPLESYAGETLYLLEIFADLTEFVKLEKARLDFVRTAAHELRTPLTSLKLGLEVLARECGEILTREQYRTIEVLSLSIERLSLLAKNLLDLASLEAGLMNFNITQINLVPVIKDAISLFKSEIEEKKLDIIFESDSPVFLVDADQYRISEVVINLLSNAVKFTDQGYIKISLKRKEANIAEICIADTGIGIPEDKKEMVFAKFGSATAPRKMGEGAGLGLSISRAIVEAHGGTMWFESQPGVGSQFYFTLPTA